ncbi:MAG: DUF177 domain-containing protein [Alphaproteobacteria bacterium]|nr:DUF177 domain-containing protein [Alphaproteobacteria bacterium]
MAALARAGAVVAGQQAQTALQRLTESLLAVDADAAPPQVSWSARGELRAMKGSAPQVWLHLEAGTPVALECQRCLQPVRLALQVTRSFRFVADEDEAARLDEESEDDDVLVLPRRLDLLELIEDELILALPLVPRHDDCTAPASAGEPAQVADDKAPHPFAALAALRRPGR